MEILKNNKLTKYFTNIQQIYCGVTGTAPPTLTGKEEKIIEMFQEVDRLYRKYVDRLIVFTTYFKSHSLFQIFGHLPFFKKQFYLKRTTSFPF